MKRPPLISPALILLVGLLVACKPTEQQRFLRQARVKSFTASNFSIELRGARLVGEARTEGGFACPGLDGEEGTPKNITVLRVEATSPQPLLEVTLSEPESCGDKDTESLAIELVGIPAGALAVTTGEGFGVAPRYRLAAHSEYIDAPGSGSCATQVLQSTPSAEPLCEVCDALSWDESPQIALSYKASNASDGMCSDRAKEPSYVFCLKPCPCKRTRYTLVPVDGASAQNSALRVGVVSEVESHFDKLPSLLHSMQGRGVQMVMSIGDLTESGSTADFAEARAQIDALTRDIDGAQCVTLDPDEDFILSEHETLYAHFDQDGDTTANVFDQDSDNDGLSDLDEAGDARLLTPPLDTDGDGLPDFLDTDSDNDGISDAVDSCPQVPNPTQDPSVCATDRDGDGLPDASDNCPRFPNPSQANGDQDGSDGLSQPIGDACDAFPADPSTAGELFCDPTVRLDAQRCDLLLSRIPVLVGLGENETEEESFETFFDTFGPSNDDAFMGHLQLIKLDSANAALSNSQFDWLEGVLAVRDPNSQSCALNRLPKGQGDWKHLGRDCQGAASCEDCLRATFPTTSGGFTCEPPPADRPDLNLPAHADANCVCVWRPLLGAHCGGLNCDACFGLPNNAGSTCVPPPQDRSQPALGAGNCVCIPPDSQVCPGNFACDPIRAPEGFQAGGRCVCTRDEDCGPGARCVEQRCVAPMRMLFTHTSPFDAFGARNTAFRSRREAARLMALLLSGGVNVVFAGAINSMLRANVAGIPIYITGGGGAPLEVLDTTGHHWIFVNIPGLYDPAPDPGRISVETVPF